MPSTSRIPIGHLFLLRLNGFSRNGCMRRAELSHRKSGWGAGNVVDPELFEEGDGCWVTAVFAADTNLDIRIGCPGFTDCHSDQRANPIAIDRNEGVVLKNAKLQVGVQVLVGIVA